MTKPAPDPLSVISHWSLLIATGSLFLSCPGPDNRPPLVTILSPADQDTVRGIIIVNVRATDNDRVTAVELLVDSEHYGTDSSGPDNVFSFSLNTAALALDTFHTLLGVAFDPAGNSDTSPPVCVFAWPGTRHFGTVISDETWFPSGNPHFVEGELVVRGRVAIRPGVQVQFLKDAGISLIGTSARFSASGIQDSVVLFTSRQLLPAAGDWRGIIVNSGTDTALVLRYCNVGYGGGNGSGLVRADAGGVAVESCSLFSSARHGIVVETGTLLSFANSTVTGCAGLPLLLDAKSAGQVAPGNWYSGNLHDGVGIIPGTATASVRWQDQGFPYYLTGTLDVAGKASPVLTIAAGCSLLFAPDAALRVGIGNPGGLVADGSAGSIYFGYFEPKHELYRANEVSHAMSEPGVNRKPSSTEHSSLAPNSWRLTLGFWQGIELWEKTDPTCAILKNCLIDRGGGNGVAAVICYRPVCITRTIVRNSASCGVRAIDTGFLDFTGNTITTCASYPVRLEASAIGTLGIGNSLSGNTRDSIAVTGDTVQMSTRWRNCGVPYRVEGIVVVGSTSIPRLTIDPGVVIVFDSDGAIIIGKDSPAELIASGVPDSITFTATRPVPGAWNGVRCHERTSGRTEFKRCRFLYGGGDGFGVVFFELCAPNFSSNEVGWSSNYCIYLKESWLDPEQLRRDNWLHDWNPDFDDIYEGKRYILR